MPWASTLNAAMVHASRAWTYSQTRCMVVSLSNVSRCEGWCVTWGDTPLAKAHKPPLYRKEDLCVALFSSLLFDTLVPSRRAQSSIGPGSCIRPLRIIPLVPKPGKMPSSHNDLRGHCHGVTPFLLPTRSVGSPLALRHVASQLAQAKRDPNHHASHAHPAQAQAFH